MSTTEATKDFVSIGVLAGTLQVSVRAIERAATQMEIVPAMRINNVPHFDGTQVESLTAFLRGAK